MTRKPFRFSGVFLAWMHVQVFGLGGLGDLR